MPYIKKFLQFIKENQLTIPFKDIDPFTFDIDEFVELCTDHGLEFVKSQMGSVKREGDENEFDCIIEYDIFPYQECEIGYKLDFKRSSSHEFDQDTLELLTEYLNIEHDNWEIVAIYNSNIFSLNILSNIKNKLRLEDWLRFYSSWKMDDGKILVSCRHDNLSDKFKFENKWIENVVDGYDNTEYYFGYDDENISDAIYSFNDENVNILCKILDSTKDLDRKNSERFIDQNMELMPNDVRFEIVQEYRDLISSINEDNVYEKILDKFHELLASEFHLIVHKRERDLEKDEIIYWYYFDPRWALEIHAKGGSISANTYLDHIFQAWWEVVYGEEKIDFNFQEPEFSTWLNKSQKEEYNSTIKSILLNHLDESV